MRAPSHIAAELETAFARIRVERMADVPILNDALRVEAVGFTAWREEALGVLVTPWFMNLMLVPAEPAAWCGQRPGEKSIVSLPGGDFEFIAAFEEGVGDYRMCSLFSPVFEFADHDTAAATAAAVMERLLAPASEAAEAPEAPRTLSRRELFQRIAGGE